ncbi:hypothetical protein GCM10010922_03030 [Microbacterium sorbitolivorans]|uniref:Uncharacterized protein n=1 Tax=Microbacterium sorbitolivorans TaxID=1867410 RepID=A0A367Y6P4_9MICO|nr:hypothetical protein [Microbacterium sorbitolivorans]RCK61534.1 hypothetical protein DTO57_02550 [Microbacterium sorbitolivorans]GGF31373.1 hypothetical protein GCM10010922_03030 [Microbacterium sorbitolivorans]
MTTNATPNEGGALVPCAFLWAVDRWEVDAAAPDWLGGTTVEEQRAKVIARARREHHELATRELFTVECPSWNKLAEVLLRITTVAKLACFERVYLPASIRTAESVDVIDEFLDRLRAAGIETVLC